MVGLKIWLVVISLYAVEQRKCAHASGSHTLSFGKNNHELCLAVAAITIIIDKDARPFGVCSIQITITSY